MEIGEIWIGIIIPIIIGPVCVYLKTLRDEIATRTYNIRHTKYIDEKQYLYDILRTFYWPVYINLLCIERYSYTLPIKNKYRYESNSDDSSDNYIIDDNTLIDKYSQTDTDLLNIENGIKEIESDSSSETYEISVNYNKISLSDTNIGEERLKHIVLDKETLTRFETNLNKKYSEVLEIIETNITKICIHQPLNNEIINFIKYVKIRSIIHEGSPLQKYNIEYFGVKNNVNILLKMLEEHMTILNSRYGYLVKNPI